MRSPPAYPSETMPSAISQTRMKSRTNVSSQRRLWPGKWSQVLWWMWTFELWLPQPATEDEINRQSSITSTYDSRQWKQDGQKQGLLGLSGQWNEKLKWGNTFFNLKCLWPSATLREKKHCQQPWLFPFYCNYKYLEFHYMQQGQVNRSMTAVTDSTRLSATLQRAVVWCSWKVKAIFQHPHTRWKGEIFSLLPWCVSCLKIIHTCFLCHEMCSFLALTIDCFARQKVNR